jgi:hypothetical protein
MSQAPVIGQAIDPAGAKLCDIGLIDGIAPQERPGGGLGIFEPSRRGNARFGGTVV